MKLNSSGLNSVILAVAVGAPALPIMAAAQTYVQPSDAVVEAGPQQPNDCVTQAANYHSVNSWILRAIIQVESGFNPLAVNRNRNGTMDVGLGQMNSRHLKELAKHGIQPRDLADGCTASYVAAWHLNKQIKAHGNTWFAVGAYHSATACYNRRYVGLVWNVLRGWKVVSGPKAAPQTLAQCDAATGKTKSVAVAKNSQSNAHTSDMQISLD